MVELARRFRYRLPVRVFFPTELGLALVALCALVGCESGKHATRPSVILISIDTLRADHLHCYGYPLDTSPAIDALARDGVRFVRAFAQVPHTLTSHMSILTSLYPDVHGVAPSRGLAAHHTTLAQMLGAHGYDTAAFVSDCRWLEARYGFDRGFGLYQVSDRDAAARTAAVLDWLDDRRQRAVILEEVSINDKRASAVAQQTLAARMPSWSWKGYQVRSFGVRARGLSPDATPPRMSITVNGRVMGSWDVGVGTVAPYRIALDGSGLQAVTVTLENPDTTPASSSSAAATPPVFLFLHYYDVHSDWKQLPYEAPPPFGQMFYPDYAGPFTGCEGKICATRLLDKLRQDHRTLTPDDERYLRALYDGGIRYTDTHIGALLDGLKARGLYDDALIVLTADHGEEFLEHGRFFHTQLYDETMHVPLIMKLPQGAHAGSAIDTQAQSIDIVPTVLELLGLTLPSTLQGRSLAPALRGVAQPGVPAFLNGRAIRTDRWKLIADGKQGAQLYDLEADPAESRDLSPDPSHHALVQDLAEQLTEHSARNRTIVTEQAARAGGETGERPVTMTEAEKEHLRNLGYEAP